jgi:hypothetical protein
VLQGFDRLFEDLPGWLGRTTGATVHGRLMHPERIEHAGDALPGGLSGSVALRDYDPAAFLRNLLWSARERQVMLCAPGDGEALWPGLAQDVNARIAMVTGAWAIGLWQAGGDFGETCRAAARLQRLEAAQVAALPRPLPERVRVWTLAQVLERPAEALRWVAQASGDEAVAGPGEVPRMCRLEGLPDFLARLRDAGYPVSIAGDIEPADRYRDVVRRAR